MVPRIGATLSAVAERRRLSQSERDTLKVTILGCSAGMPTAGRASAGYLVRAQGATVLLDAGPGVATALTKHVAATELDAIFISHLHTDHVYDLLPIGKMLVGAMTTLDLATGQAAFSPGRRIPLIVPRGARDVLVRLSSLFPVLTQPWLDRPFDLAFDIIEHAPDLRIKVGNLVLTVAELQHVATNYAVRLDDGERSLVYSGDTGVTEALPELAAGAGALLVENTLTDTEQGSHGHLSTADAARAAAQAQVSQLILTHYVETQTATAD